MKTRQRGAAAATADDSSTSDQKQMPQRKINKKQKTAALTSTPPQIKMLSKMGAVQPVVLLSRSATKKDVLEQREAAAVVCGGQAASSMLVMLPPPPQLSHASSLSRGPRPVVRRISGITELRREALISGIEEASSRSADSSVYGTGSAASLHRRLLSFGLSPQEMVSDGACQFRALSHQLLGHERHHAVVRKIAVAHMRRHAEFFGLYFEGRGLQSYLSKMAKPSTWGDELTLRAATEVRYRGVSLPRARRTGGPAALPTACLALVHSSSRVSLWRACVRALCVCCRRSTASATSSPRRPVTGILSTVPRRARGRPTMEPRWRRCSYRLGWSCRSAARMSSSRTSRPFITMPSRRSGPPRTKAESRCVCQNGLFQRCQCSRRSGGSLAQAIFIFSRRITRSAHSLCRNAAMRESTRISCQSTIDNRAPHQHHASAALVRTSGARGVSLM